MHVFLTTMCHKVMHKEGANFVIIDDKGEVLETFQSKTSGVIPNFTESDLTSLQEEYREQLGSGCVVMIDETSKQCGVFLEDLCIDKRE